MLTWYLNNMYYSFITEGVNHVIDNSKLCFRKSTITKKRRSYGKFRLMKSEVDFSNISQNLSYILNIVVLFIFCKKN